jgi:hypothetical protein
MTDIDKIASRPSQYLAQTGVAQIVSGLIWFFLGASVLIQRVLPKGFSDPQIPVWIALGCAGATVLGARALQQRIVFPRGGYVQPRPRPAARSTFVVSIGLVVAFGIIAIVWPGRVPRIDSRFMAPGFALAFAIICLVSGRRQNSSSMMLFGAYLACLAPLLGWMPLNSYELMCCLEVGVGVPLAVAGAVRLRNFLRANPGSVETTNE